MSLALVLLSYVYYMKNKIIVKSDYSLDTLKEKDLLVMAFARYWQTDKLLVPSAHDAEELQAVPFQDAEELQADDYQGLTKAAILNSDFSQVKIFLHKAAAAGAPSSAASAAPSGSDFKTAAAVSTDSDFYETVAAFYYSQTDDAKYGVFGAEYLFALSKLLEFHVNDGKYLLGRADYYKKREDYDAARADYRQLMDIYPDDLWIPYAIAYTYRKQEMKEEAKSCLKYINKNIPRIQVRLQNQAGSGDAGDTDRSVIESNEQVGRMAKALLKSKKPASNV